MEIYPPHMSPKNKPSKERLCVSTPVAASQKPASPVMANQQEGAEREYMDDMENRSRRCNLRLTGLPEGLEGNSPTKFVGTLLLNTLGPVNFPSGIELQRAHRALAARPKPGQPPRVITMQFLRYQDKERALAPARQLGTLSHENNIIRLYPDYSFDLQQKRRRFDDTKKILREKKVDYRLVYPARLIRRGICFKWTVWRLHHVCARLRNLVGMCSRGQRYGFMQIRPPVFAPVCGDRRILDLFR
uniref:Uncharacterized protein n=1 Tax=Gadus morhua TaxID=8049 RepID=A0A8C5BKH9_GADMO